MTLEWFINKVQYKNSEVVHLDNAIESGLPFWKIDEFDARLMSTLDQPRIVE